MDIYGICLKINVLQYVEMEHLVVHVIGDIRPHDRYGEMDILYGEVVISVRVEVKLCNVVVQQVPYGMEMYVLLDQRILV
jgi:hypothetical protein